MGYEHPVDESRDFDFGVVDIIGAALTFPLLMWSLMYAVTGGEHLFSTRAARVRLYGVLLGIELLIVGAIVASVVLR